MTPTIATFVYLIGILGLFWLDRDPDSRTSKALWMPVAWILITFSRPVSAWLGMSPPTDPAFYLEGSPIDRLVFTTLLVLGICVLLARAREVVTILRTNAPILLFFTYCAVSCLWSDYPDVAFKRWIKALGDLVMVLIVLTEQEPSVALKKLFARTSFLLVPISILFIKYYPQLGREYHSGDEVWTDWTAMYTGVTTNKNTLGMITLLFGLGAVWRFLQTCRAAHGARRSGSLIAHGTILAMTLWLLWIAGSATSLSCFLMGSGLMIGVSLLALDQKPVRLHLLVASLLTMTIIALFFNSNGGLVGILGRNTTLTGRTEIWQDVLGMAGNSLLGRGFESFWLGPRLQMIWSKYWWHPNEAHNGYIEVYLNLGWLGIALLTVSIVWGYRNILRALQRNEYAATLRLALFVSGVAYSLTEAGFRMLTPIWILFLLAIIVVEAPFAREGLKIGTAATTGQGLEEFVESSAGVAEGVV